MKNDCILFFASIFIITACNNKTDSIKIMNPGTVALAKKAPVEKSMSGLAEMLSKKEVPVLCYHHIRNFRAGDSESMKSYSVTPEAFAQQMKALSDSGYHTILPDQLYEYLVYNGTLPDKPVLISFDDTDGEQYTIGATELNKYGFKGVFFIMTVSLNRSGYMSKEQLKNLADSGHVIAGHTWDHHMVTRYEGSDWNTQLVKPKIQLEAIAGKPVEYFAYPFGIWNPASIPELKSRGYKMAFILSTKRDTIEPLFTIRRMIVPGTWTAAGMMKAMKTTFNK